MSEQENVKLVQDLYAAFGRGDIPTILKALSSDVQWFNSGSSGIPYAGKRQGVDQVAQFFQALSDNVMVKQFEPTEYVAQKDRVIALGNWRGQSKSTGRAFDSDWAMVWTVKNGKVTSFRGYEDTAAMVDAFRKK